MNWRGKLCQAAIPVIPLVRRLREKSARIKGASLLSQCWVPGCDSTDSLNSEIKGIKGTSLLAQGTCNLLEEMGCRGTGCQAVILLIPLIEGNQDQACAPAKSENGLAEEKMSCRENARIV